MKRSKTETKTANDKQTVITFQISKVLCTGKFDNGWTMFEFILLSQEATKECLKLTPNNKRGGNLLIGSSTVIPFMAPYVIYKGLVGIKNNKKDDSILYNIYKLVNFEFWSPKELTLNMFYYILHTEVSIGMDEIKCRLLPECKSKSGKFECYNLSKLQESKNEKSVAVWEKYKTRSQHAVEMESKMVLSWFDINIQALTEQKEQIGKLYQFCTNNVIKVYFGNLVHYPELDTILRECNIIKLTCKNVNKDAFLQSIQDAGLKSKIDNINSAIAKIERDMGKDTIFLGSYTPEAFDVLEELVSLGLVKRFHHKSENGGEFGMVYHKLIQFEMPTDIIIKGVETIMKRERSPGFDLDCSSCGFNTQQKRAIDMVLLERKPIVCIMGPPGTGKTMLIQAIHDTYLDGGEIDAFYATAFINTAVARMERMGITNCKGTCAMYATWMQIKRRKEENPENTTPKEDNDVINVFSTKMEKIKLLVVEEFSNFSEKTLGMLMDVIIDKCPLLSQVVFVFDPIQIKPIENGNPALDICSVFQSSTVELTTNHRVVNNEDCRILIENGEIYRRGEEDEFKLSFNGQLTSVDNMPMYGCFDAHQLSILDFYKVMPVYELVYFTQTLCFQNVRINELNGKITQIMKERLGSLIQSTVNLDSTFYRGERIMFVENVHKTRTLKSVIVVHIGVEQKGGSNIPEIKLTPVNNGDVAIVKTCYKYYPDENMMYEYGVKQMPPNKNNRAWNIVEIIDVGCNETSDVDMVDMIVSNSRKESKTRFIWIHDQLGVPSEYIKNSWVMSVDKFQGGQAPTILLELNKNDGLYFEREHGLVAITRAMKRMLVFGDVQELTNMSRNRKGTRFTDLSWRLKNLLL